jgi:hypothetical protein
MELKIDPQVLLLLETRAIQEEDILRVLPLAEENRRVHVHNVTGHRLAYSTLTNVTYWIEYDGEKESYRIFNAYSHRMKILEGYNMASKAAQVETGWRCQGCDVPLVVATVKLSYLDETFAADLPSCPSCQHVFVSEETATVKMALAERMLEDK